MLGRCPSSILQSTHPFLHLLTRPFIHPSTHLYIHSSIHPSIPPSIHLSSIHSPTHPSIHSAFHPSTNSFIHPSIDTSTDHCHAFIHSCLHSSTHVFISRSLLASPPSHIPPLLHTSILSFPHAIHMLHFQIANKMQSLPSESLRLSDDLHDPRPTRLSLGQCLPCLAAPPFGLGHLQSEDSQTPWMAFTLSLHLHNLFFCLLYYSSKVGQGSGWEV